MPRVGLFPDCVATRLRTGIRFDDELRDVQEALGPVAAFAGDRLAAARALAQALGGVHPRRPLRPAADA